MFRLRAFGLYLFTEARYNLFFELHGLVVCDVDAGAVSRDASHFYACGVIPLPYKHAGGRIGIAGTDD